jgi:nucleoside phosphorylase
MERMLILRSDAMKLLGVKNIDQFEACMARNKVDQVKKEHLVLYNYGEILNINWSPPRKMGKKRRRDHSKVMELINSGMAIAEVASALDIPYPTIQSISAKYKSEGNGKQYNQ